jgi:hypothetical protein
MRDLDKDSTYEVPELPWLAYHEALYAAHLARGFFLQRQVFAVGRRLRDRFCNRVHRLNIGIC